jgi:hypothetical protein
MILETTIHWVATEYQLAPCPWVTLHMGVPVEERNKPILGIPELEISNWLHRIIPPTNLELIQAKSTTMLLKCMEVPRLQVITYPEADKLFDQIMLI